MQAKMRKGFTLIELMIVIAIIAIIAAIAIPNLMQSRIRANEANAVTQVKAYATAQVTFQVGKLGTKATNSSAGVTGYCDNYRNLFYGQPLAAGNLVAVQLVGRTLADACILNNGVATISPAPAATQTTSTDRVGTVLTPPNPATTAAPLQGYYFREPADATAANFFTFDFALVAVPANSVTTGTYLYWVNQEGAVWALGAASGQQVTPGTSVAAYDGVNTPTTNSANWVTY